MLFLAAEPGAAAAAAASRGPPTHGVGGIGGIGVRGEQAADPFAANQLRSSAAARGRDDEAYCSERAMPQ